MDIKITDAKIVNKILIIDAFNVDEIRKCRDERGREERIREIQFCIDSRDKDEREYFIKFLHRIPATKGSKTYGEAVKAIIGCETCIRSDFINPYT